MSNIEPASVMDEINMQTVEGIEVQRNTNTKNNDDVSTSNQVSKKAKVSAGDSTENPKGKSLLWEWFAKFKDTEGREKAKCKHCNKIYAADPKRNGTTALRTHMMNLCRFRKIEATQKVLSFSEKREAGGTVGSLRANKFDDVECKRVLAKMIVVDELPFKFVENEGFRVFANHLESRFKIPSRTTIAKYCTELFTCERKKLKKELTNERLCLTTDTWTSIQRFGYMCLTAHWIDSEWRLQKRILNFVRVVDHTGEGLGMEIMNCLSSWGIKKIFTITMDNASVNDVVARHVKRKSKEWKGTILGHEFLQVRCTAHIINLIVKDGLSDFNESIEKIRLAIKYVKSSSQRLEKFKRCVRNAEIESKALLCLDVETRWNSTYLMLETSTKFEKAFVEMEDESSYISYFKNEDKVDGPPSTRDWQKARMFVKLLKMFYNVTLEVSGSKYPTSHLFFQNISMMEHMIKTMCASQDATLSMIAQRMKAKFDKYWGTLEKSNVLLYVAFVLDPQCKIKRLTKCFNAVCEPTRARKMVEITERTLDQLYEHYNATMNPSQTQTFSTQASSSSRICLDDGDMEYNFVSYQKNMFEDDVDEEETSIFATELTQYLREDTLKMQLNFDILNWWKANSSRFPILSEIAKDILAIPISTVASESAFSTGGRVLDPFRSSLAPKTVEALICARDWLRCKPSLTEIEEMIIDEEKFEELDKDLEKDAAGATVEDEIHMDEN